MIFTDLSNPVVDDKLPAGLRKELNKLSSHPVLQVPMRTKGITAGKMGCCYWNANVISQSFGGKPVYGFLIDKGREEAGLGGYYRALGHGCWMTPEGKLVDVTNTSSIGDISETIGFLPLPHISLALGGALLEQIKSFYYGETTKQVRSMLSTEMLNSRCYSEEKYQEYDDSYYLPTGLDVSRFCKKLVSINGARNSWMVSVVDIFMDNGLPRDNAWEIVLRSFGTHISPVTHSTSPVQIQDPKLTFRKIMTACRKTGKSAFDVFPNHDVFEFLYDTDLLTGTYGTGANFVNTSLRGRFKGKFIQDIPPRQDIIEKVVLPKSKTHLNKLFRKADEYGLTPQEYLMMSSRQFALHPHLVNRVMNSGREFQEWKDTKVKFVA